MRSRLPVLLVDDDSIDVMTVKRAFREVGITNPIDVAGNGEEALAYLERGASKMPCLILLDLNMPKMNGLEFLQVAKRDGRLKMIPVVVLTTSKGDDDKLECFKLGVAGYMAKSVEFDDFLELVKTIDRYWTASEAPYE